MLALAEFIAATRPGYDLAKLAERLPRSSERLHPMEIPMLAISSTEIRARVARGAPIQYLVPDLVVQYVAEKGLYRPEPAAAGDGRLSRDAGT